jgi:ubiquinone/menaquinone biosynthesis C-methylase UbiE
MVGAPSDREAQPDRPEEAGGGPGAGGEADTAALFDAPSWWRADAARRLGLTGDELIAAASPGAGFPAALRTLARSLRVGPGRRLVDVGGGLGGASRWLADATGAEVVLVEPAAGSVAAARTLFGDLRAVIAEGDALPLQTASVDAATLLGVTSLVEDLGPLLAEVGRALRPGGRLGVSDLVAADEALLPRPPNTFRTLQALADELDRGGFTVTEAATGTPTPAESWRRIELTVTEEIRRLHHHEPGFARWAADQAHLDGLAASGAVATGLVVAESVDRGGRRPG